MGFRFMQQHRNYNERCRWWKRNENIEDGDSDLIYKRIPEGIFYAKEANAETNDDNIINGTFMINRTNVTIETLDDILGIESEDFVEYEGELWRVTGVQKRKARIQHSEFGRATDVPFHWYLNLRK